MKYSVVLEPQEEDGYTVRCLELPGAISQGETKTEALENIKEAIGLILEVLQEDRFSGPSAGYQKTSRSLLE
jgi:predicted RNase H-like HicB family nuclease